MLRLGGAATPASSSWASALFTGSFKGSFCTFGVATLVQRRFVGSGIKPKKFELETPELASADQTVEELRNLEGNRLNWKNVSGKEASNAQDGSSSKELGGPKGPEPTRYTDWEVGGRVSDF